MIADRIAVARLACVDQMDEQAGALDVTQKTDAEARAFVRAFDEAGEIRHDERAAELSARVPGTSVGVDDAEVRFERREGIIGDLGARCGNDGDERGFSGVGETHEPGVRK